MKALLPGQAALIRLAGKIALVACDHPQNVPIGPAKFDIRGGLHRVAIGGITVPVVSLVLRLTVGKRVSFYPAWVNELEENVIEPLANQPDLPIVLSDLLGGSIGRATVVNGVRDLAQRHLGIISTIAADFQWSPQQFAAALVFIESKHPTPEDKWRAIG